MNEHDTERIAELLQADGMAEAASMQDADVVVLNTCCIRENADNKLYGNLGHLKPWKEAREGRQIILIGHTGHPEVEGTMGQLPDGAMRLIQSVEDAEAVAISYGTFINNILDFIIIAFAIFLVVKAMNAMKKKEEEAPAEPPKPSNETTCKANCCWTRATQSSRAAKAARPSSPAT